MFLEDSYTDCYKHVLRRHWLLHTCFLEDSSPHSCIHVLTLIYYLQQLQLLLYNIHEHYAYISIFNTFSYTIKILFYEVINITIFHNLVSTINLKAVSLRTLYLYIYIFTSYAKTSSLCIQQSLKNFPKQSQFLFPVPSFFIRNHLV